MRFASKWITILSFSTAACGGANTPAPASPPPSVAVPTTPSVEAPRRVTVTLIGTNDVHGRVASTATLAGYLANVRHARAEDHGAVVLLDGGDMFQGTLESNLNEGRAMIQAYNALGYDAAAVGNHEFDFGPEGDAPHRDPHDNPRGALLARANEATFPILTSNIVDAQSGNLFRLGEHGGASVLIERAGLKIGIVGGSTESTPHTTAAPNFVGLKMDPLATSLVREARALREQGADLVFVAMHAGGKCEHFDDPHDTTSCENGQEIQEVTSAIPEGLVDGIVAAHTHAGMAHFFNNIPVIESYANGSSFGRIDFTYDTGTHHVVDVELHHPERMCGGEHARACDATTYEGVGVTPNAAMRTSMQWAFDQARSLKEKLLGVTIASAIHRDYDHESALGNLLADLVLAAAPDAEASFINSGGIRTDLAAGALRYGQIFEMYPFDNLLVRLRVTGALLKSFIKSSLQRSTGFLNMSGIKAVARCGPHGLEVEVLHANGHPVRDDEHIIIVTSDFIATGGDGVLAHGVAPEDLITHEDDPTLRDAMATVLEHRGGTISGDDPHVYSRSALRWTYPGDRPVHCEH